MGDPPSECDVIAYTHASFAGDYLTSRSTSACFIALVGPNTFAPINARCKKQSAVSHPPTESEIVSLDTAIRTEALPILSFWEDATRTFELSAPRNGRNGRQGESQASEAEARSAGGESHLVARHPGSSLPKTTKRSLRYCQRVEHQLSVTSTGLIA